MSLKTPKGTTDLNPDDALVYEDLIDRTKNIFKLHGAVPIDTPVFELKSILLNKYGEDTKLIYDLKNNGGEECALRYDLTVPFSRYMSMNKLKKIKRYQIGKVYRRDQPSVVQGRWREFLQADFDIAGESLPMMADSELVCCMNRLLKTYNIGDFVIRVSDKRILYGIFEVCEIPNNLFATVSSSIDKLDKMAVNDINKELKLKGLTDKQIINLNIYIQKSGTVDVLDFLRENDVYKKCSEAVDNLCKLYEYCKIMKCSDHLIIDLSLARGLDYYTGMIIEGKYLNKNIGSVAGGGRYDNLIGSLENSSYTNTYNVPCAGFSIGLSRIFSCIQKPKVNTNVKVFISASGKLFLEERLKIQSILWEANISLETFYNKRNNPGEHKKYCVKHGIKYLIVVKEEQYNKGFVTVIEVNTNLENVIMIDNLPSHLQ